MPRPSIGLATATSDQRLATRVPDHRCTPITTHSEPPHGRVCAIVPASPAFSRILRYYCYNSLC